MRPGHRFSLATLVLAALAVVHAPALATPSGECTLDQPTLECVGSTQTSITLRVCAGPSGAPGGVSIHWKKKSDYDLNGWDQGDSYCNLSLSGQCPTSRFSLEPNECQDITIHVTTVTDELAGGNCGASAGACLADLECDTEYVFRVFAHAEGGPGGCRGTNPNASPTWVCRTAPCDNGGECALSWGYWKTHGPAGCNPSGGENVWPLQTITVGGLSLTQAEACAILQTNPSACAKGGGSNNGANAVIILEHQLIAAQLNYANGAIQCDFVDAAIQQANTVLAGFEYACVGTSTPLGQDMIGLYDLLESYNNHMCSCPTLISKPVAAPSGATEAKRSSWGKMKTIYR